MLDDVIAMAAGRKERELLLINARVQNVLSGDLETTRVAVGHRIILGLEQCRTAGSNRNRVRTHPDVMGTRRRA
ncbi:MAG TPA: hypothetical protein VLK82_02320 [Candidatus Tectomicrobia bacterium]|nr:hypothetical protein [Candidatus Tectomicrobia bacterium]